MLPAAKHLSPFFSLRHGSLTIFRLSLEAHGGSHLQTHSLLHTERNTLIHALLASHTYNFTLRK
jgi:hypothetical protein